EGGGGFLANLDALLTQYMYFWNQSNTGFNQNCFVDMGNQVFNIPGSGRSTVNNEVGVFVRHHGTPHHETLQVTLFNQTGCIISYRISENRSAIRQPDWL